MTTLDELIQVDPRSALRLCHRSVDFRAEPTTDGRTLEGYAAVFDTPTVIESHVGDFEEEISRGAFRKTLRERRPVLQFDHGRDKRTGTIPIGSIRELREDDDGLFVSARMFDNEVVEPIRQAIEGQAIRGMSFRFRVVRDRWLDAAGEEVKGDDLSEAMGDPDRGPLRRQIREVELFELGPVVFPAYDQTSVGVRSMLAQHGLDERCVRRTLSLLGPADRDVLARQLTAVLPELRSYLEDRTVSPTHETGVVEGEWDASTHVGRLPSPMSVSVAQRMYAWYDAERVEDGQIVKDACSLPHHVVSTDGTPGAANLNGVRNALSRLPQSNIPASEHDRIRAHLRAHLPDGEDDEASAASAADEPGAAGTGTPIRTAEPAPLGHSAHLGGASWYLPPPESQTGSL